MQAAGFNSLPFTSPRTLPPRSYITHPSSASSKAASILLASGTVAVHPAAGRQGVQIGYATVKDPQGTEENLGLTKGEGGVGETRHNGTGVLVSPAKVIDYNQTSHTTGAYRNANLSPSLTSGGGRPASAMVRGYSSPQQAYYGGSSRPLSAATTSYVGGGSTSQGGTSTWNSRPTSAFISGSPVRPGSAVMTHASFASSGASPARPVRGVHSAMASNPSPPTQPVNPSAYAKPTPMHIAHGNANAQVLTQQVARVAHKEAIDHALGVHSSHAHPQDSSRTPGSSPTTERSVHAHRAASAGRKTKTTNSIPVFSVFRTHIHIVCFESTHDL